MLLEVITDMRNFEWGWIIDKIIYFKVFWSSDLGTDKPRSITSWKESERIQMPNRGQILLGSCIRMRIQQKNLTESGSRIRIPAPEQGLSFNLDLSAVQNMWPSTSLVLNRFPQHKRHGWRLLLGLSNTQPPKTWPSARSEVGAQIYKICYGLWRHFQLVRASFARTLKGFV